MDIVRFLMTQEQKPITFTTAAMTVAHLASQVDILKIDSFSLDFVLTLSPMIGLLYHLLSSGHYDDETIKAGVVAASEQSELYYKTGKYESARISFYVPLLFGETKNIAMRYSVTSQVVIKFAANRKLR